MPIYEYQCQSCNHKLEKLQRLSDPVLTDCPECSEAKLRRLISAAGFRLKGAGWYETDFKKDNKRNLAESSNSEGEGAGKSSADTDKKEGSAKTESANKSEGSSKTSSSSEAAASSTTSSSSSSSNSNSNKSAGSSAKDTA